MPSFFPVELVQSEDKNERLFPFFITSITHLGHGYRKEEVDTLDAEGSLWLETHPILVYEGAADEPVHLMPHATMVWNEPIRNIRVKLPEAAEATNIRALLMVGNGAHMFVRPPPSPVRSLDGLTRQEPVFHDVLGLEKASAWTLAFHRKEVTVDDSYLSKGDPIIVGSPHDYAGMDSIAADQPSAEARYKFLHTRPSGALFIVHRNSGDAQPEAFIDAQFERGVAADWFTHATHGPGNTTKLAWCAVSILTPSIRFRLANGAGSGVVTMFGYLVYGDHSIADETQTGLMDLQT